MCNRIPFTLTEAQPALRRRTAGYSRVPCSKVWEQEEHVSEDSSSDGQVSGHSHRALELAQV